MERHTEQLLGRLLDAGTEVTVLARTCRLDARPGLRFRHVPTPRRPFVIAYPLFFIAGSLMAAREPRDVLHTTGAIVGNRAELSTVHYCHRAARDRVAGSRASRPGLLYRLNEKIAGTISRSAEAWSYRPGQTRLLCPVSEGVAEELSRCFPAMAGSIRSVPNGVDSAIFRPDGSAREAMRAELGVAADEPLALFVGGDWERKGLAPAVAALATALRWQLAVAGDGHVEPILALARRSGVEQRLHLLGAVRNMAAVYAAADAFVLPTSYEAFPLVVLEAAASALPLLVSRVNGTEEFVEEGRNGWFITAHADDIASRLNQLSDQRGLAVEMGGEARRSAASYSWDAMASRYLALYSELASSGSS